MRPICCCSDVLMPKLLTVPGADLPFTISSTRGVSATLLFPASCPHSLKLNALSSSEQMPSLPCYKQESRAASLPAFPLLQVPAAQAIRRCRASRCRRCLVTSRRTELRRCPLSPYDRFQQSERHSSASLSTTFPLSQVPAVSLSLGRQRRGGKEHAAPTRVV